MIHTDRFDDDDEPASLADLDPRPGERRGADWPPDRRERVACLLLARHGPQSATNTDNLGYIAAGLCRHCRLPLKTVMKYLTARVMSWNCMLREKWTEEALAKVQAFAEDQLARPRAQAGDPQGEDRLDGLALHQDADDPAGLALRLTRGARHDKTRGPWLAWVADRFDKRPV